MKASCNRFAVSLRALSVGVLVAFLLAGWFARHERVLCIGEDGQRRIEYSNRGFCADSSSSSETASVTCAASTSAESRQNHCGSCVDIPIVSELYRHQAAIRGYATAVFTHTGVIHNDLGALIVNENSVQVSLPVKLSHCRSVVQSLRATVLLI